MKNITHIITSACTALSIISLAFSDRFENWLRYSIFVVGVCCFAFLIIDGIKSNTRNERICKSYEDIEEAMKEIINSHGQICIMSRDLSWVTPEISACLETKKDSVLIFAESENKRTRVLTDRGVNVLYYGKLGFAPKTRFTIIRYNKNDPQVAIANMENSIRRKKQFKHIIYQTSVTGNRQDEWINSLAVDMVKLCEAACKDNGNA